MNESQQPSKKYLNWLFRKREDDTMIKESKKFILSDLPNSIYIFLLVFILASVLVPNFFSPGNIATLLTQACALMLLSVAMSMSLMMGCIDLSLGGVVSMTGVIMAILLRNGTSAWLSVIVGLLAGMLFGLFSGVVVTKLKVPSFIATFGAGGIAQSLANTLSEQRTVAWEPSGKTRLIDVLGDNVFVIKFGDSAAQTLTFPVLLLLTILVITVVLFAFKKTNLGSNIYALGANEETARLAGIAPSRWKTAIFINSGLIAAIASIVLMVRTNSLQPMIGENLEFQAVVAAVLGGNSLKGGKGSIPGAIMGALVLYVIRNAMSLWGIGTSIVMVVIGATLVIGMIINEIAQYIATTKNEQHIMARQAGRKVGNNEK